MRDTINIFERKIYSDESKLEGAIRESVGDVVVSNTNITLVDGESVVLDSTKQEQKMINGKLHQQVVNNNKIYWEEI